MKIELVCTTCNRTYYVDELPENPDFDMCPDCSGITDRDSDEFDISCAQDNYWLDDEEDEYDD